MRLAERLAQTFLGLWNDDPVDVVRHQAIGQPANAMLLAVVSDETDVLGSIGVAEKHGLPMVAPVGDMVPATGYDNALCTRHATNSCPAPPFPLQKGACHIFFIVAGTFSANS